MSDTSDISEPTPAHPWRRDDGPQPTVTAYPWVGGPVLEVFSHGAWRWAPAAARQDWADGRVLYQVSVRLGGDTGDTSRLSEWPQPGLRIAERPTAQTRPTSSRYRQLRTV